jgi:hypothetical protein
MNYTQQAQRAGQVTSTKDKADAANVGQVVDQENEHPNSAEPSAPSKADSTLIATAAIAGFELVKLADGTWLAHRWGMFKPLADAQGVQAWLARVGATHHA